MSVWRKLKIAVESGMRQHITRIGFWFTVTILFIGLAAFASANNLLFLILAAMISTFLVSGFISRLSLAGLEVDFIVPEHLTAGRKIPARILLRNTKFYVPSFSIHLTGELDTGLDSILYYPIIPGGETLESSIDIFFTHRGELQENNFQFSTRFPFGFMERRVNVTLRREIVIYPSIDPRGNFEELLASLSGEIEAQFRGRGSDFYRIRPYEAFESSRHVDWKATAHTGDLQVREFTREEENCVEILLDLDIPPEGADWFESAVDCCAYLSWEIARRGARLRFRSQDADILLPGDGDVYTILKYLALVSPSRRKAPPAPDDPNSYQIVFSAAPERMEALGWTASRGGRLLGLDAFANAPDSVSPTDTGTD